MKKQERHAWILSQLAHLKLVDVLNAQFVDDYTEATGAAFIPQFYGAAICRQLGRDLSELYKANLLKRSRVGIHGAECGFPRWVYVYEPV